MDGKRQQRPASASTASILCGPSQFSASSALLPLPYPPMQLTRNRLGEDAIAGPIREASAGRSRNGGHFFWRVLVEKVCVCWREKKGELRGCVNDPGCKSRTRGMRPTMGVHCRGEWGPWSGFGGRARGRRPGATEVHGVRMEAPLMRDAQPIRLNYGPAHAMDEFRQ